MTISAETNKVTFAGDDATTVFASSFKIFDDDDIEVSIVNDTTDVVTVKTKTTHYTVSTITAPSSAVNITMLTAPASGETLVLRRAQSKVQSVDLVENDNLPAQTLENQYDKLVMMIQELQEELDRCVKLNPSQSLSTFVPTLSGNGSKYLQLNSGATAFTFSEGALDISDFDAATPVDSDLIVFRDATDGTNKKVTLADFKTYLGV